MRRKILLFGVCIACLFGIQVVYAGNDYVHVHSGGHYLEWNGRPFIPVGDSVTQGWMESGYDFNYKGYIDALERRNLNVVMLWTFNGTNDAKQNGYKERNRLGGPTPEIWPWHRDGAGKFNLDNFNEGYFDYLKKFVAYANEKNMIVLITVFDGWIKDTFYCHPFNKELGGPLSHNRDFVVLGDYKNEILNKFEDGGKIKDTKDRNQYYQEKFADKLITTLKDSPNVIFEMFNEGEWYDKELKRNNEKPVRNWRREHERHFLRFFKNPERGGGRHLLLSYANHIPEYNPHSVEDRGRVDVVSLHGGWTKDGNGYFPEFPDFVGGFNKTPKHPKPYMFSEPVYGWKGAAGRGGNGKPSLYDIRRSVWETTLSGAGWVNQNDASWGWNENTAIFSKRNNCNTAYDFAGYCASFLNNTIDIVGFVPMADSLSSEEVTALVKKIPSEGKIVNEYVAYSPKDHLPGTGAFFIDLPVPHRKYYVTWLNPQNGDFKEGGRISAGGRTIFSYPSDGGNQPDWVLWLHSHCRAVNPGVGLLLK